ncbi:hypothetical protein VNO80_17637 [Phaseolus coccineus]|uniref:Uncharacterized protein n=1 Tax=Phaseolus coccineus TaxID=3886 RepID=A0AAN9R318_PHACN
MHLTECLLEPPQEIVANMKMHHLLVDYFEASLETCRCCDTILQAIQQTRLAYARLATSLFGLVIRKRFKRSSERLNRNSNSVRQCEQLDVAAKGVFVLINELRLDDEVEHWREVADICVKNGKSEILKRVLKEFQDNESNFFAKLEELEDHIYLCFLTVNRSRSLVMQEITEKQR